MAKLNWTADRITECMQLVNAGGTTKQVGEELTKRWGVAVSADMVRKTKQGLRPGPAAAVALPEQTPAQQAAAYRAQYEERSALTDTRKILAHMTKELAEREAEIAALSALKGLPPCGPIKAQKRVGRTQRQGCPVMLLSDLHVEERVDPEKVAGLNRYSLDISEQVIRDCGEAFSWFLREDKKFDCRTAVIAIIGDMFSGYIHDELKERNFLSPVQASLWCLEKLERMLRQVAADCPNIERFTLVLRDGNHGRLTQKIRAATRTDNSLEWMMLKILAGRLSNDPRFVFDVGESLVAYLDIYQTKWAFTHGDQFQYQGGIGGLLIPVRRGVNELRKHRHFDHICMGHFHQFLDGEDVIVNGSGIGVTGYSLSHNFPPEVRRQTWMMVDSERGKCARNPIWLPRFTG